MAGLLVGLELVRLVEGWVFVVAPVQCFVVGSVVELLELGRELAE